MVEKWLIPCNNKQFDLVEHFRNNEEVVWRRVKGINKDDILYIYLSSPYSEIKYKCLVTNQVQDSFTNHRTTHRP